MQFGKKDKLYSYVVQREAGEDILYFNYQGAPISPSLADHPEVMERVIDSLIENSNVSRIMLVQQKNYNYDFQETEYLLEIASLYTYLLKQEKILSHDKLVTGQESFFPKRYNELFGFLYLLKSDPIAAYFELKKILIEVKINLEKSSRIMKIDFGNYTHFLESIFKILEKTKLIQKAIPFLNNYKKGDRKIYNKLFRPDIIPNFTFTRLVFDLPEDAEIVDQYEISMNDFDKSNVTILKKNGESKLFYHLSPPENTLSEEYNDLLNLARGVLIEHQPKAEEFTDTERTRQVFFNVAKDLIRDLSGTKGIKIDYSNLNKLAMILVRHTIGFGLIEVLLQDKRIQDVSLNAPISQTPNSDLY